MLRLSFLLVVSFIVFSSCQKESLDTTSKFPLKFSTDTLTFDTVFQTLGSATRSFRIYNRSSNTLIISRAFLSRGTNSQFRFNIDGLPGTQAEKIRILPNDSLWVFSEVTVSPNPSNPVLILDSLILETNGSRQVIIMRALGQNAYFHYGEVIQSNTSFLSDKPHVIIDKTTNSGTIPGLIIAPGATLNIEAGTQLHFSNSSGIIVQGSLKCNGTKDKPIKMRGLRLEKVFLKVAGQWLGLLFERNSKNNLVEYTTLDESAFGVWAGYQSTTNFGQMTNATRTEIYLKNSTISNAFYWTLRSMNCKVLADNCQFFTSTDYLVQLLLGGEYQFRNCTLFNIQSKDKKGNLILTNQFYDESSKQTFKNKLENTCFFENCIINSNTDESILLDIDKALNIEADCSFRNCNYNSKGNLTSSSFVNCQLNQNPLFINTSIDKENLKLKATSPCVDKGISNSLSTDILGNPRPNGNGMDIGAFESF